MSRDAGMDTCVSGKLLFPSYFTLQSKLALSGRVPKVGSPIDAGRRVAWRTDATRQQGVFTATGRSYLVRITPGV